ncbi:MAG TPA: PEP-CTERM sorting domain-containing protein [Bryobacteraceae bacterium]|nr:PEP-CTERM sorting domain-containing protein [Bryobacteraceae bacterium]
MSLYADTFIGGVENNPSVNTTIENIGDFNDMIFQLSAAGLTLVTSNGQWNAFSSGIVNQNGNGVPAGNPYFDNPSQDGTNMNIGYCLTTANCGSATQTAGASMNEYLAASGNTSLPASDFYFTFNGTVSTLQLAAITPNASNESVGVYDTTGSHAVTWFIQNGVLTNASFTPPASFGLIFQFGTAGTYFYSQNSLYGFLNGTRSLPADNRFAVFTSASAVPEPGTMALLGLGALALGLLPKLRKRS